MLECWIVISLSYVRESLHENRFGPEQTEYCQQEEYTVEYPDSLERISNEFQWIVRSNADLQISQDSSYFFLDKTSGAAYSLVKQGVIKRPFSARCCLAKPKSTMRIDDGWRPSSRYMMFRGCRSRWTANREDFIRSRLSDRQPSELTNTISMQLFDGFYND